jgi:Fe-S-cluster containining protein
MNDTLRFVLPEVYAPLLPDFFEHATPHEEKATCNNCAMAAPPGTPPDRTVEYFRPDAKCCTYHPMLPNYLVGAILADPRPDMAEGKRRIRERIALRTGVSPRWIAPPRKTEILQKASWRTSFGRSLTLLCPYFERTQGNCTIWRHRDSVCTTFYCKYNAGADGAEFWLQLRKYTSWLENKLSDLAAKSLVPEHNEEQPAAGQLSIEELEDRPPSAASYGALWKERVGREEEFYLGCHAWVQGLDRGAFEALVHGADYTDRLASLAASHHKMLHPELPERLVPNPSMGSAETADGVLVAAYSRYEPLLLTKDLFAVVRAFDKDSTVAEVRERLRRESELDVPDELLLSLYQFRVLVTPAQAEAPSR